MNFVRTSVFSTLFTSIPAPSGAFSRQVPHGAKSQWDEVCLPQAVLLKNRIFTQILTHEDFEK